MLNLAVIDTKTNEIRIVTGKKKELARATFARSLDPGEVEVFRVNPSAFLDSIGWEPADTPEVA